MSAINAIIEAVLDQRMKQEIAAIIRLYQDLLLAAANTSTGIGTN